MRGERYEICWISVPFTAGVAAAASIAQISALACGIINIAFALSIVLAALRRRKIYAAFTFFIAGLSIYATDRLTGGIPIGIPAIVAKAQNIANATVQLIMDMDFKSDTAGPLVCALITGDRTFLPKSIVGTFRAAGASHILALSGLHLGIIYTIVAKILSIAGNKRPVRAMKYATILILTGFYVIATGASPSVTRAYIYIILSETAKITCRKARPLHLWMTALLIQLTFSPSSISDIGFQLSYLAMAGIAVIHPFLKQFFPDGGKETTTVIARKMWETMSIAISCQATTAPLVWHHFHTFPKYFLITNLLIIPIVTTLIITSILTVSFTAFGITSTLLITVTDHLATILIHILQIISTI